MLKILYLEDSDEDVELVTELLASRFGPCQILRADSRSSFETALRDESLDLVLSDYTLPTFDGLAALVLAKALRPELPFIMLSGIFNELIAENCRSRGAASFVPKHQYAELPSILWKALTNKSGGPEEENLSRDT